MAQQSYYPKLHRLLHWALAFSIGAILLTVFLRMTWMDKSNMALIIQSGLNKNNISLPHDQIILIAKSIRNEMFQWHFIVGYIIGILLITRVYYSKKVAVFIPSLTSDKSTHDKLQGLFYIGFYLFLIFTVSSGLTIYFLGKEFIWYLPFKTFHKLSWIGCVLFIIIHVSGAVIANGKKNRDTITKIING